VVWVAGREELLMTLGALACFHFHLSAQRLSLGGGMTGRVLACHVAAAVSCAAACLSNAVAAVIPLLIVAWDMLTLTGPKWRRILGGTAALWAIALVTVAIKGPGANAVLAEDVGLVTARRLMLVLNAYWRNLTTLAWPTALSIFYGLLEPRSFLDKEVIFGGVAACLTCLAIWKLRAKKSIRFGLLWFCLALTPTAQILPHHVHRADRFLYLPLVGLALAVAAGIKPLGVLLRSRVAAAGSVALGLLILLLLDLRSMDQVQTWRDSLTMWENCVEVCPDSAFAHDVLARNLARRGELERYQEHARKSLELDLIRNHQALCNRAMGLALFPNLGLVAREEAVQFARRACDLTEWKDPECLHTLATAYCSVANAQATGGDFGKAVANYRKAIQADGRYSDALFGLAVLRMTCSDPSLRDPQEAIRLAERGCQVLGKPDPRRLSVLSQAYVAAGRLEMAVATAEKALRLAEAAGDAELADEIRRWVKGHRNHSTAQPNAVQ
jgi:tetratricopeptide (TPR) repeat protein